MDYFKGRTLFLVSKHRKEEVIFPVFENLLGVSGKLIDAADTDLLGTFTGEIPRKNSPLETVKLKSRNWLNSSQHHDLVLATEGSFGPHPHLFFIPAHQELIHFVDLKNGWELTESMLSTETNFARKKITSEKELLAFAHSVQFPSHGLIVRTGNPENPFVKGIFSEEELFDAFNQAIQWCGEAEVETDMRAMCNPSLMRVIEQVTEKLCQRLLQECHQCRTPGFGFQEVVYGLACELCGSATHEILHEIHGCVACNFQQQIIPKDRKDFADPGNCPACNP